MGRIYYRILSPRGKCIGLAGGQKASKSEVFSSHLFGAPLKSETRFNCAISTLDTFRQLFLKPHIRIWVPHDLIDSSLRRKVMYMFHQLWSISSPMRRAQSFHPYELSSRIRFHQCELHSEVSVRNHEFSSTWIIIHMSSRPYELSSLVLSHLSFHQYEFSSIVITQSLLPSRPVGVCGFHSNCIATCEILMWTWYNFRRCVFQWADLFLRRPVDRNDQIAVNLMQFPRLHFVWPDSIPWRPVLSTDLGGYGKPRPRRHRACVFPKPRRLKQTDTRSARNHCENTSGGDADFTTPGRITSKPQPATPAKTALRTHTHTRRSTTNRSRPDPSNLEQFAAQ